MECAVHPSTETSQTCSVCKKPACDACATFTIDGEPGCESCGRKEEDRAQAIGSALLALVGVGYLATLAIGVMLFRPRPLVGGIAALVAIGLGRILQVVVRTSSVRRRAVSPTTNGANVDAARPAR